MSDKERLFTLACEMLEAANIYSRPVSDLCYKANGKTVNSLTSLVADELENEHFSRDVRSGARKNRNTCYKAIGNAMGEYVRSYPASASFKKRVRSDFRRWLEKIAAVYHISSEDLLTAIDGAGLELKPAEKDTVIDLVKALHPREGVTREQLAGQIGIGMRAVLKDLCKLDPKLRPGIPGQSAPGQTVPGQSAPGQSAVSEPFYLGGQPVRVKISSSSPQGDRKKYFRTPNTMNPIVLQENLLETATLIRALSDLYESQESWISSRIATDIWHQLSEYTKSRIKDTFCKNDPVFSDFVEMIGSEVPDDHAVMLFETEREMFETDNDMSIYEKLMYYEKLPSRHCYLKLRSENDRIRILEYASIQHISGSTADDAFFKATAGDGKEILFSADQVICIE